MERTTERDEGAGSERTTVVKTGGGGLGLFIGIAVLALVALVAVFLVVQSNRNSPDQQVADAASSIASSASRTADSVGDAASGAANGASNAARDAAGATQDAVR